MRCIFVKPIDPKPIQGLHIFIQRNIQQTVILLVDGTGYYTQDFYNEV